jgi:hypothetical protein
MRLPWIPEVRTKPGELTAKDVRARFKWTEDDLLTARARAGFPAGAKRICDGPGAAGPTVAWIYTETAITEWLDTLERLTAGIRPRAAK